MSKEKGAGAIAVIMLSLILCVGDVFGFAEEPIGFRDPLSIDEWDDEESTIHTEMTYFLALAAGFSASDAAAIAVWNQLVDSEKLGSGDAVTYSNCLGSYEAPPDREEACPDGYGAGEVIWPMAFDSTCATSRFGPYSPFFHFPHNTDAELVSLREWGWGRSGTLRGYAAYAWGGQYDTVLSAACRYMRSEVIETGMPAGSIAAFGTYLHSLADYYSHSDCMTALAAIPDKPYLWGTHTVLPATVPACYYVPSDPKNTDAHGQEFGASGSGTGRTLAAANAVFDELTWRSTQWWGDYQPLTMNTVLAMAGSPTLGQAISLFITSWDFKKTTGINPDPGEYAGNRRAYSDQIAAAILSQRTSLPAPDCSSAAVWLGGTYFESDIQTAYLNLARAGAMKIKDQAFPPGDLNFTDGGRDFSVTLLGGYDCSFSTRSGSTHVIGAVTISSGTIVLDGIVIN